MTQTTQVCRVCETGGAGAHAAVLTIRDEHERIGLCADCVAQGAIYTVRAILADGQAATSEEHVGQHGREWMTLARAERVIADLETDIPEGCDRYEVVEVSSADVAERVAEAR